MVGGLSRKRETEQSLSIALPPWSTLQGATSPVAAGERPGYQRKTLCGVPFLTVSGRSRFSCFD
jgi:hypothetical protein